MKHHPEANKTDYSKSWWVSRWLSSPRWVSERVTLRTLVVTVVVIGWTSGSKSGSSPPWSEHLLEELGVEHSGNSTPSESLEDASVSLKRTLGTFSSGSKEQSQYGLGDTGVLAFRGVGGMIFGYSPDASTGLETLEFSLGQALGSTAWHTGSSATWWITNWAKGFSLSTL